jgi:acetolactate synthase-1/2/3 large subunit
MKTSDFIALFLESMGVQTVFELSGGAIVHLLDSISRRGKLRLISVHHEQAAAFAADAVGRLTGIPGVAMATSGPGATNLITGIASCYFDSSPAVFITGQVNRDEQKKNRSIRQLGFQETDIVQMVRPITKRAWLVERLADLPAILQDAFALAVAGRPGPVLVDIPMDIQRLETDFLDPAAKLKPPSVPPDLTAGREALFSLLAQSARPLILAGSGTRFHRTLLRNFARAVQVPVVTTLLGLDAIPFIDPLHVGMIGSYGNRWANLALGRSDLLIVLGSRLDVRQTGSQTAAFREGRAIFHVDCDPAEINNRVSGCHAVVADVGTFLQSALARSGERVPPNLREDWLNEIHALRRQWPDTEEFAGISGINPNAFMHSLSQAMPNAGTYIADVGQNQMWAAQSLELAESQRFLTCGGMGAMGFALPAALGVASVDATRPIVVIAGDGGFQCNLQELQTVVRNRFPIKIVILNNGCHGMVRQFQQSYFDGRYQSTLWGYSAPDFALVAKAYGLETQAITESSDVPDAVAWLRSTALRPALLSAQIDTYANAYPKVAFGSPLTEMEPFAESRIRESTHAHRTMVASS